MLKPKAGRPKHNLTPDQIELIAQYAGFGLTLDQIAVLLKISKKTLERKRDSITEVFDAMEAGKANALMTVAGRAYKMAESGENPSMTRWWLEVRGGFKQTTAIEVTGAEGSALFGADQINNMAMAIVNGMKKPKAG